MIKGKESLLKSSGFFTYGVVSRGIPRNASTELSRHKLQLEKNPHLDGKLV